VLEIHRNERCETVSSREWKQIQEKSSKIALLCYTPLSHDKFAHATYNFPSANNRSYSRPVAQPTGGGIH